MKILTFTTLFPNAAKPHHGIFTETTLRHQLATREIQAKVVAPVPWFPFTHRIFSQYGTMARAPEVETRIGVEVFHPRYAVVPKMGMRITPFSLAYAAKARIGRLLDEGYDFDVIDAHYFYPDGVAAIMLGRYFSKPVVISALGTDINLIPRYPVSRRMIRWAGAHSAGMIAVCEALRTEMIGLGMDGERITTLRNGVDLELFQPIDRNAMRKTLDLDGFVLLSVGHLDPRKGHELVISALPALPDVRLLIVGSGPDLKKLQKLSRIVGVADRVSFLDAMPQAQLRNYYAAADALVLASSREGWANVLLEAMACGTPVVASNVWGTPEVVQTPAAGVLMPSRTAEGVAAGVWQLRAHYPDRAATRAYAERFSWAATTYGQISVFRQAAQQAAPSGVALSW